MLPNPEKENVKLKEVQKKKLKIGPQKKKKRGPLRMYSNKMKKKFLIEFETSRMSQAEFCRQNNLDKNCISRWLKKKKSLYSMTRRELQRHKILDIENMWKKHSIFPKGGLLPPNYEIHQIESIIKKIY